MALGATTLGGAVTKYGASAALEATAALVGAFVTTAATLGPDCARLSTLAFTSSITVAGASIGQPLLIGVQPRM